MKTPDSYSHKPTAPALLNCSLSGQSLRVAMDVLGGLFFFVVPNIPQSPCPDVNVALQS